MAGEHEQNAIISIQCGRLMFIWRLMVMIFQFVTRTCYRSSPVARITRLERLRKARVKAYSASQKGRLEFRLVALSLMVEDVIVNSYLFKFCMSAIPWKTNVYFRTKATAAFSKT